jgi:hypothetical protein
MIAGYLEAIKNRLNRTPMRLFLSAYKPVCTLCHCLKHVTESALDLPNQVADEMGRGLEFRLSAKNTTSVAEECRWARTDEKKSSMDSLLAGVPEVNGFRLRVEKIHHLPMRPSRTGSTSISEGITLILARDRSEGFGRIPL